MSYVEKDIHVILDKACEMIPKDSEFYSVIAFARKACETSATYREACEKCEEKYKEYNWVHAYPNMAFEIVAMHFAGNDFEKAMTILMMAGQDNDCTGGPIGHAYGTLLGKEAIGDKFILPLQDQLDTYVRTMESQTDYFADPKKQTEAILKYNKQTIKNAEEKVGNSMKMKKLAAMTLCAVMCATTVVPVMAEEKDKVIGLLIPSPEGDPFISLCIKGLEKLADEQGATLKIVETVDKAEYEDQTRAMAEMGANPVYTMWGDLSEIADRIAPEYPDTDFVLCDVYMETDQPNVSSVAVDPSQSAFIAGVVAANNTEVNKVGFIAHADRPVSRKYRDGYIQGVEYVNPDIEVKVAYVGNDQDPVKGQEVAKLMVQNEGVDLNLPVSFKKWTWCYCRM